MFTTYICTKFHSLPSTRHFFLPSESFRFHTHAMLFFYIVQKSDPTKSCIFTTQSFKSQTLNSTNLISRLEICTVALLALPTAENLKLEGGGGLQWHDVLTQSHELVHWFKHYQDRVQTYEQNDKHIWILL